MLRRVADLDSSSDEGGDDGASLKSWNIEDECISNQSLRSWQVDDGASLKSWKLEDDCTSNQSCMLAWEWLDDDCITNESFSVVGWSASPPNEAAVPKGLFITKCKPIVNKKFHRNDVEAAAAPG